MKKYFNYNFSTKTIEGSKSSISKANKGINPWYQELTSMLSIQPSFSVVEKQIKKNEGKKTYHGLTFSKMEEYISTKDNSTERLAVFKAVQEIAKAKGSLYPITKKWFLEKYPEFKKTEITLVDNNELLATEQSILEKALADIADLDLDNEDLADAS